MNHETLARGVPRTAPGAVVVLTLTGRVTVGPAEGRAICFGRNRPEVDVCVGETDLRVSRRHGALTRRDGYWWVDNTGRLPIRLPGTRWLFRDEDPIPLPVGYTPLFIRGSRDREHLLELYVAGEDGGQPAVQHGAPTQPPRRWRLTEEERLLLVVLGQRYLLHEASPQPISRQQAAEVLAELRPDANWSVKRVEHMVHDVRARLSAQGVYGLRRDEVGEPVGNALNENLLRELVLSTTLVPPDLALLDPLP
ncbi:hypothetical protein FHS29_003834 [Saccharothrix tamanrassetensis]|uniref:FHA domain-containing protein n=1 Tax=Saccharothrix tamanrassetensis TaxID=1051531 RepID=A0A841CII5_9PSEU|nr:FHA domain-containing protein [Saccharothrix tamanrassetensis]MBB5957241.1 hypothetical protein [Saccharothrix tamanrassetensis]